MLKGFSEDGGAAVGRSRSWDVMCLGCDFLAAWSGTNLSARYHGAALPRRLRCMLKVTQCTIVTLPHRPPPSLTSHPILPFPQSSLLFTSAAPAPPPLTRLCSPSPPRPPRPPLKPLQQMSCHSSLTHMTQLARGCLCATKGFVAHCNEQDCS